MLNIGPGAARPLFSMLIASCAVATVTMIACGDEESSPGPTTADASATDATKADTATDAPADTASSCTVRDVSGYTNPWKPPAGGFHRGVCSNAQLKKMIECAHIVPAQLPDSCKTFVSAPENAECVGCANELLRRAQTLCIAIATDATSVNDCPAKFTGAVMCGDYACAGCPLPTSASDNEARANLARCADEARSGVCKSYWDEAACLKTFVVDGGPADICQTNLAPTDYFLPLICGADTSDGGADANADASSDAPADG